MRVRPNILAGAALLALSLVLLLVLGRSGTQGGSVPEPPTLAAAAPGGSAGSAARSPAGLEELPTADNDELEEDPLASPVRSEREVRGSIPRRSSFYEAMAAEGIRDSVIYALTRAARPLYNLGRVRPGQEYRLTWTEGGDLESLYFETSPMDYLEILNVGGTYSGSLKPVEFETCIKEVAGTIESSLYETLRENGAPTDLAAQMADIYAWEIDFFKDIRRGDAFSILYEEYWREGELSHLGRILAAEFVSRGEPHYAFFFDEDPASGAGGYYDEKGASLQKQFLRAPLKYSRISSRFTNRRLHPIHRRYMAHRGIDYVAPTGTPVHSTGDGVVEVARYRRGNGNYVRIRHNSTYTTYYLHLSRFARGIRSGVRVRQGQCIGYVGSTGTATAPHLDYRIKKNGRFVNPRRLDLPPDKPVPARYMASYRAQMTRYLSLLGTRYGDELAAEVSLGSTPGPGTLPDTGKRTGAF